MSIETSLTVITICQIILTAMILAAVLGIIFVVFWFKNFIDRKINEVMDRFQPVVDKAMVISEQARDTVETVNNKVDSIMTRIESTTNSVSGRVDSIMEKADTAAGTVTNKVESVKTAVDQAMNPQVMSAINLIGLGIKAYQIYRETTASAPQPAHQPKPSPVPEQEDMEAPYL